MLDKLNTSSESWQDNLSDKLNTDPLRFEKRELAALHLSIEEKNDALYEKKIDITNDKKEKVYHATNKNLQNTYPWLPPISQEALQKRAESAQSVVTMVQDAKNETWIVGILWSWASSVLHGIDV